jgi:hypothetical protein
MATTQMILLFGMPRSGTTWLGKLFDAQRQTYYLHEPDSAEPNLAIPLLLDAAGASTGASELAQQLPAWFACNCEKVTASRPFFSKDYLSTTSWLLFLTSAYATKIAGRLGLNGRIKPLRLQPEPEHIVWKSIESLGRMAAIKQLIPAYSIHILRHPCGHIASTLKGQDAGLFDGGLPVWEDWDLFDKLLQQSAEPRFSLADIKRMTIEERLAVRWGIINDFALSQAENDTKNMVLLYEDLCRQPVDMLQQCLQFCQLNADEQCLKYLQQSVNGAENTAYYSTIKDPLTSAFKWRKQLTTSSQQRIWQVVNQFRAGSYYTSDT